MRRDLSNIREISGVRQFNRVREIFGQIPFNPLDLDPFLYLNAGSGVLNASDEPAGYLDPVSKWSNPGSAADPVQTTGASQPLYLSHTGANYLHCPGVGDNNATTPDSEPLRIIGDLGIDAEITPGIFSGQQIIVAKWTNGYFFRLNNKRFNLLWRDGGTTRTAASDADIPFDAKEKFYCRVTLDVDDGAGGHGVRFFTSSDGVTWTQLGSTISTGSFTTSILDGTAEVRIGAYSGNNYRGAIHRVQIFASTDGTDKRLDVDFSKAPHRAASFTADTEQTVTINTTGLNPAVVVGKPMIRFDGVDDFLSGAFASAISGGRMFALFSAYGTTDTRMFGGGTADNRIQWARFTTANAVEALTAGLSTPGAVVNHEGARPGRFLLERQLDPAGNFSQLNGADTKSGAGIGEEASLSGYKIGARADTGANFWAGDLEALMLFPALTEADAAKIRALLL